MDEWWEDALLNITQECISRDNFVSMTECSNLQFRNGICELITLKNRFDFPFMIVSAGIGEIIKSAFHLFANEKEIDEEILNKIFILSNLGIYNERNVLVGFESPTQTIMNKDENIKKRFAEDHKANNLIDFKSSKSNIILCGDMTEDANMLDKIEFNSCIKIGFFNSSEYSEDKALLESFCGKYDIIITNDGNLETINFIIKLIAGVKTDLNIFDSNSNNKMNESDIPAESAI